jgi:hypothetical protein
VHIIYLVPSDVGVRRYVQNLRDAAVNLQAWYDDALGIGKTFTLAYPTVEVHRTERTAAAYTADPVAGATNRYGSGSMPPATGSRP